MNYLSVIAVMSLIGSQAPPRALSESAPIRTGTASLHGHVIDAVSEKPVAGVRVRLSEMNASREASSPAAYRPRSAETVTDEAGMFTFAKIAAGSYGIIATSKTHLPACLGSTRLAIGPCAFLDIADDQDRSDADVFVRSAAMLNGRVVDHEGKAVPGANIRVISAEGDRTLALGDRSNSDGRFEVGGIPGGLVTLSADFMGTNGEGSVRAYYPGVLQARDSQPIGLEEGRSIDVELRIPKVVAGSVNASVSGPAGFQLDKWVFFQPEAKSVISLSRDEDGPARIHNVREGRYLIEARGSVQGKPLAAFTGVDVRAEDIDVSIDLEPTGVIAGRIVAERGGVPHLSGVRVAAVWMWEGVEIDTLSNDEAEVGADGAFVLTGLFGSRAFKLLGLADEWRVVSVRAGRTDVTASAFDIEPGSHTQLIITVARQ